MKELNLISGLSDRVSKSDLKNQIQSLDSLNSKTNITYLDSYNIMVRHLSIFLYNHGFKFRSKGVHKTIVEIINNMIDCIDISSIVRARHKLKYQEVEPNNKIYKEISVLTSFLIIKNKLNTINKDK